MTDNQLTEQTEQPVELTEYHSRVDSLEKAMLATGDPVPLPLSHHFTDGLYTRQIFMPAGSLITSKIHRTQHPYAVMTGRVSVFIPGRGVEHIAAPFFGVTQPGTRRVLFIHEDCVWITFHPNPGNETDLTVIEQRLIEPHTHDDGAEAFKLYEYLLSEAGEQTAQERNDYLPPATEQPQLDYTGAP